jgi:hypothetical protein
MRKVVSAVVVLALFCGIALSAEISAIITKIDGNKITFADAKGKGERGPEKTMTAADNVKVLKGKFNPDTKKLDAGDPLEGGLKSERLSKIGEKGVRATIYTDAGNTKIEKIVVGGGGKGKGKGGR